MPTTTRRHYVIEVFNVPDGASQVLHYYHTVEKGSLERPQLAEVTEFIKSKTAYRGSWHMVKDSVWKKVQRDSYDWSDDCIYDEHLGGE